MTRRTIPVGDAFARWREDPAYVVAYDALEQEFALAGALIKARAQAEMDRQVNPAWHIHAGSLPNHAGSPISFAMLLNLASVVNADTPDILWGFIRRYAAGATADTEPFLARRVDHAIAYYQDFVRPAKQFRQPDDIERSALEDLAATLAQLPSDSPAEAIQNAVFEVGKRHAFAELRAWFFCLYQVLLGQQEGPRFGGFVALYGIQETIALIHSALNRQPDVT